MSDYPQLEPRPRRMSRLTKIACAIPLMLVGWIVFSWAAVPAKIASLIAIGDPTTPTRQACVDARGGLCVVLLDALTIVSNTNALTMDLVKLAGNAIATGNGATTSGTARVTLANDSTGIVNQGGAPWSQNTTQLGGNAINLGAGAAGTGTQRIITSTDSANSSIGTQLGAAPSGVVLTGAVDGAAGVARLRNIVMCNTAAQYDASTNGTTQLVALSGSTNIYICGYTIFAAGTVNVQLVAGTGSSCGTGQAAITPAFQLTTQTGVVDPATFWRGLNTGPSQALCLKTTAGVAVQAVVYYSQAANL